MRQKVIFYIHGSTKNKSLYRDGMSPVVYSTSRPEWYIYLYILITIMSNRQRLDSKQCAWYENPYSKNHYVLAIFFEFDNETDQYYFAYCFPYTYTYLQKFILNIESKKYAYFHHQILCKTILNKYIEIIINIFFIF